MSAVLFTNVRDLRRHGQRQRSRRGAGRRATASTKVARGAGQIGRARRRAVVDGRRHDPDARHGRGPLPPVLHRRHDALAELGMLPPEEHMLKTRPTPSCCSTCGFTSVYSRRLGQAPARRGGPQRDQRRRAPGPAHARRPAPRSSRPAGLGDERQLHLHRESFALIADGAGRVPPGRADLHPRGRRQYQAQHLGRRLLPVRAGRRRRPYDGRRGQDGAATSPTSSASRSPAHSRSANSVKLVGHEYGVDCIYHCELRRRRRRST